MSHPPCKAGFDGFAGALKAKAGQHGIFCRVAVDAVSLRYTDGCDSAFWGREERGLDAEREFARFQQMDLQRGSVLTAFRHFAQQKGLRLHRSTSGTWRVWRGNDLCEVEAGWLLTETLRSAGREAGLRSLAYQTRPLFATRRERGASWIDREELTVGLESLAAVTLTPDQVAGLLAHTAPPQNEHAWWEDPPTEIDLEEDDHPFSRRVAAHWKQPALPLPPRTGDVDFDAFCAVLLVKASRLDIASHYANDAVSLRYRDGCDAALWERSGRKLRGRIAEFGPTGAADLALAEFQGMDRQRTRVLIGFRHWAVQSHLTLERSASGIWECGNDQPEKVFVNCRLTERIRRRGEPAALRSLMPASFLGKEARRLTDTEVADLLAKTSPPPPASEEPPAEESVWDNPEVKRLSAEHTRKTAPMDLAPLEEWDREELDSTATRAIEQYKRRLRAASTDDKWLWRNPLWYRRSGDAWIDEAWWIETAIAKVRREGNLCALATLLANGRDEFRPLAIKWIDGWAAKDCPNDHEWRRLLAFVYPEHPVAKSILEESRTNDDRALQVRLGQFAVRHFFQEGIAECLREGFEEEAVSRLTTLGEPWAGRCIEPRVLEACKEYCVNEASGSMFLVRRRHEWLMECAAAMNWPQIAEALAENPAYVGALFGGAVAGTVGAEIFEQALIKRGIKLDRTRTAGDSGERPACYDSNHFRIDLLAWSLVCPGEYAGRLAAKALHLAKIAHPHPDDVLAAAIAWKRFRMAA